MAVSEAQKKSAQKWDAANLDRVSIAMPKGKKDEVKAAAVAVGESMNQYIISAIDQRMGKVPPEAGINAAKVGDIKTTQNAAGTSQDAGGAILTPETLKKAQEAAQNAEETVSAFIGRAVDTQAQRDRLMQAMRQKEKAPDKTEA